VRAGAAADASEAVLQHAARRQSVGGLRDDRVPRAVVARKAIVVDRLQAVQIVRYLPDERRRLGASGSGDATRRRRWRASALRDRGAPHLHPLPAPSVIAPWRHGLFRRTIRNGTIAVANDDIERRAQFVRHVGRNVLLAVLAASARARAPVAASLAAASCWIV